jgi:hypothetical protein
MAGKDLNFGESMATPCTFDSVLKSYNLATKLGQQFKVPTHLFAAL